MNILTLLEHLDIMQTNGIVPMANFILSFSNSILEKFYYFKPVKLIESLVVCNYIEVGAQSYFSDFDIKLRFTNTSSKRTKSVSISTGILYDGLTNHRLITQSEALAPFLELTPEKTSIINFKLFLPHTQPDWASFTAMGYESYIEIEYTINKKQCKQIIYGNKISMVGTNMVY